MDPLSPQLGGEDTLHSALASIPDVSVIVLDTEMRIHALHGTALQRHGYVHERMIGQTLRQVMPLAVWRRLEPLCLQALAGETVTFGQASLDGKAVYESTFSPVVQAGVVVGATMTSRDVTAQATAEAELANASGRLQAILDHSPMAIYLRDTEERWIVANPEACGILGKSPEELIGRTLAETVDPGVYAHLAANDREVMNSGEARSFEELVPDSRSGQERHVWSLKFPIRDAEGCVVGLGGVSLDVTARERATRELAAARALFETAFASAPIGMLVSRVADDGSVEVIQCNPAFAAMVGREPSELLGSLGAAIVHPDDLGERRRMLDNVLAGRPASGELRFKHADGHDICALTAPSLTHGPDGERLIVLQAVDISERKRLDVQLQEVADRDSLTGLFSRRRFQEELEREVSRARRHGRPGARCCSTSTGSSRSTTRSATRPATSC